MDTNAQELLAKAQKTVEERERCLKDKLYLAKSLGYDFVEDVHQELFDQYLQMDASKPLALLSPNKNMLILWPRGHFKSTSITVEIVQLILNYPDIRIVIMRSTKEATEEWLTEILSHFTGEAEGSRLRELFPEFCGTRKQLKATASKFVVPNRKRKQLRESTVTVASQKSNTTGKHFDVGCFDDLVTAQNYQNPKLLEKVTNAFYHLIPLIAGENGYMYVTGTRYAFGDLYETIIRKNTNNTWKISVKTCWTDDGKGVRFPQRVITTSSGDVKVIGFTREALLQIMQDEPGMFSSQYLNRPVSEASSTFSDAHLTGSLIDPVHAPPLSAPVLFIDLASTTANKSDDSVILVGKLDTKATIYCVDGRGDRWEPMQLAYNILEMVVKHRPMKVMFENTAPCQYFVATLRMVAQEKGIHVPIDFIKVDNRPDAKIIRVKGVLNYLSRGRLKFFKGISCWDKMKKQFINFTGDKHNHDDYPDTVALMCNFFSGTTPPPPPPVSNNQMVALLSRDVNTERMFLQEEQVNVSDGDMGSDFAC
jgi:predicted phage terminase large subunit-like protein